jgi:hypothetical protein
MFGEFVKFLKEDGFLPNFAGYENFSTQNSVGEEGREKKQKTR